MEYNQEFYHSQTWIHFANSIKRRDKYLCQECKRYGKNKPATQVHHIIPIEIDYSKRFEASNCISLCDGCHMKKHPEKAKKANRSHINRY